MMPGCFGRLWKPLLQRFLTSENCLSGTAYVCNLQHPAKCSGGGSDLSTGIGLSVTFRASLGSGLAEIRGSWVHRVLPGGQVLVAPRG